MLANTFATLSAGLVLGMLHAFDPDHVMAISAMSSERPGLRRSLRYCAHWALGHGGVLLLSALLLFGLGIRLPEVLQVSAEAGVGVVLIIIGMLCFWRFHQQHCQSQHRQNQHCQSQHCHQADTAGRRTPTLVGMLHGLAGSASALALVPIIGQTRLTVALGYILVFSIGVLLSMMTFGLGFGLLQRQLRQFNQRLFQYSRYAIASGSVLLGSYWMVQSL